MGLNVLSTINKAINGLILDYLKGTFPHCDGASTPGVTHHTTAPVDREQSPVRCLAQPATPFPPGETVMGVQPDSAVRVIRKISEYEPDDSYPHCPEQWIAYRGSCYSFSKEKKDWHSSQESCWAQGAHLLVISDTSEMFQANHLSSRSLQHQSHGQLGAPPEVEAFLLPSGVNPSFR
ncbi:Killer cell lectin-like receptor subfamily G member 1 [Aix galericulata]|nr:Killer cell lectin-like receptor subfamily G member 1 [Aix galericulata]